MKKLKIGLDVDDVLAGLYIGLCLKFNKPIVPMNIWDTESWIGDVIEGVIYDEGLWVDLPSICDPKSINFDVDCYISNIPEEFRHVRENWLARKEFPKAPLFTTSDKLSVIKERGLDYFIDDRYETINQIEQSDCKCVGIQYIPWYHNPEDVSHEIVSSLKEFTEFIIPRYE